jgi:RNA polymerase sigma factor (sigma-70 family)
MRYEDDQIYIQAILAGDTAAFAHLVNKHKTMAFNIAYRLLKSREEAEEVMQDSFLKIFHALKEFRGDAAFSTWMYRIIYNQSISRLRKKKLPVHSYDDENFEWMEPADTLQELEKLHASEQKKYVAEAIGRLPGDDANIVSLFYMNESSVEEISEITGLSQSNVKVKLFRARKRLYEELNHILKKEINHILT